ncbi:MAG: CUB domain-containing protein [Bacteroidota bacterium]
MKLLYSIVLATILFTQSASAQYCAGTVLKTTASGTFSDGSGASNYGDDSDCSWLIQPAGAGTITLTFVGVFDLELWQCSDKITIYDGNDTLAGVLAVLCGNSNLTPPAPITSTGGVMLVRFTSDESYNNAGWDASYTSTIAPPVYCSGSTTLTTPSGAFSDGSSSSNYGNNANCSWLIEPVNAASITLTFSALDLENGFDFVKVYDNSTFPATLTGSYSGNTVPAAITINSGYMLVEFTSNNTTTAPGWAASYTSTLPPPVYCSGSVNFTAPAGSFDDGSGTDNYGNDADCSWFIQPANAATITLTFSTFNTQGGQDVVEVYNEATSPPSLLGAFSGSAIPSAVTLNGSSMSVHFTSNSTTTDLGWAAAYTSTAVSASGINEHSLNNAVSVYPNPFHNTAVLQFSAPEKEECELTVCDIYGKAVKKMIVPVAATSLTLDASMLPNGMYFYYISKKNTTFHTGKMIVE